MYMYMIQARSTCTRQPNSMLSLVHCPNHKPGLTSTAGHYSTVQDIINMQYKILLTCSTSMEMNEMRVTLAGSTSCHASSAATKPAWFTWLRSSSQWLSFLIQHSLARKLSASIFEFPLSLSISGTIKTGPIVTMKIFQKQNYSNLRYYLRTQQNYLHLTFLPPQEVDKSDDNPTTATTIIAAITGTTTTATQSMCFVSRNNRCSCTNMYSTVVNGS